MHRLRKSLWDHKIVLSRRSFETDVGSWHSSSIWKRSSFRFSFSRTEPHHMDGAKEDTIAMLDQETPNFIPPALSPPITHQTSTHRPGWLIIHRVECASGASLSYQDLGRRRTETTHQQRVGRSESHGYWMCRCEWRQRLPIAFVLEADILSTRCNKNDVMWHVWLFWATITASHVCRYSVKVINYSNIVYI